MQERSSLAAIWLWITFLPDLYSEKRKKSSKMFGMKSEWSSLSSHSVIFPTRVLASVALDAVVGVAAVAVDVVVEISQKNRSCLNRQNVSKKKKKVHPNVS